MHETRNEHKQPAVGEHAGRTRTILRKSARYGGLASCAAACLSTTAFLNAGYVAVGRRSPAFRSAHCMRRPRLACHFKTSDRQWTLDVTQNL